MIYNTLFATDDNSEVKPQMGGKYEVSADQAGARGQRCHAHSARPVLFGCGGAQECRRNGAGACPGILEHPGPVRLEGTSASESDFREYVFAGGLMSSC